jgi:hypothetical protein
VKSGQTLNFEGERGKEGGGGGREGGNGRREGEREFILLLLKA